MHVDAPKHSEEGDDLTGVEEYTVGTCFALEEL